MIEDMRLRNLSQHTIDAYVVVVKQCAQHFKQSPDRLSDEQVREYLPHLVQEKRSASAATTLSAARCNSFAG
jgi:site-specific recombinase XerD